MNPPEVELTDGTRLWCVTSGSGPPVVLCHGGPGLWDYLGDLAALLEDDCTVIRFEQRGCGRSAGQAGGPFTLAQAVDDLEQVRQALGFETWAVLGHSWGAELALRYAAEHPSRTTAVVYVAGVGAGDGFWAAYAAERDRRLDRDRQRWHELEARARTAQEEREWCLLQWRPDFSPTGDPLAHAEALWRTRPPQAQVNARANRELSGDRSAVDLLTLARNVQLPVTLLCGADDPRPWTATDALLHALPTGNRIVLDRAGHAPWVERPGEVRSIVLRALGRRQLVDLDAIEVRVATEEPEP